MGYTSAIDMADLADLETGIAWQLQSNHFPPVPEEMVGPAVRAVKRVRSGKTQSNIKLPEGVSHRVYGNKVPAWVLVESYHLEPWIE